MKNSNNLPIALYETYVPNEREKIYKAAKEMNA